MTDPDRAGVHPSVGRSGNERSRYHRGPVADLVAEYAELEQQTRRSCGACRPDRGAGLFGRRYAALTPVVRTAARALDPARGDRGGSTGAGRRGLRPSLLRPTTSARPDIRPSLGLAELLAPRDPDDAKDVILEIKAGEGGEESALFAGDLLRMYLRYAERRGWKTEISSTATESELGGYKDVTVAVKRRAPAPADGVWARLKFEGGVHRVQRVPVTEPGPDPHLAAGVWCTEADEVEVEIDPNDLRIDVFRSSGPRRAERQHHRLRGADHPPPDRHRRVLPEREVAAQNKEQAMRILRARLLALAQEEAAGARLMPADPRCAPSTARSGSARTIPGEPDRRPPHRLQGLQPRRVLDGDLDAVLDAWRGGPGRAARHRHQWSPA